MVTPPKIFVSYSHKDRAWLEKLQPHFKALERDGAVDLWDDTEIKFGADWDAEIAGALDYAKAAILLVSADFLASDYIINEELDELLERRNKGDLLILIVVLRPCWLGKLARFQTINDPEEPLIGMSDVAQEKVFVKLVETIKKVLVVEPQANKQTPQRQVGYQKTLIAHITLEVVHQVTPDQPPCVHDFHQNRIIIGRDSASDLPLSDPLISKLHAEIIFDDGKFYITDLDSTNLTHLNEKQLKPHQPYEIQPGNIIRFGSLLEIGIKTLDTESDNDQTIIDIINPYKDDIKQLATILRRIGEQYSKETSHRHQVMLEQALSSAISDSEQNEAYVLIARWLLKNVDDVS